ncbi:hypothetical protein ABVL66_15175 [Lacticaseibacillus paracasei]|uniref:hypothetical protein n=1 Tax=Lacticaseibacillus paracasei TaxID=1597 RepID=UPI00336B09DB
MKANVAIEKEVSVKFTGDWTLNFQKVVYQYSDGTSDRGYRFIWRRPDGHLQAARGQARIPERKYLEELTAKAEAQGWY